MRGTRRAGWVAVGVAALVLAAGEAGATKPTVIPVRDLPLTVTGTLSYTWSADPARCAAVGVCGIHGELILRPQPSGQSASPGGAPINVFLEASGATRVVRQEGGATVGECVDLPAGPGAVLLFSLPARRAGTASVETPPSSGRCAGPTSSDLARVSIPVRRTGGGRSYDLTGTRSFSAGPFSGVLVSTLRLLSGHSSQNAGSFFSSSSGSSGPGRPDQPTQAPRVEFVQIQYRVSAAPSAIQTQFSGAGQPACQIVDACGTSGSETFSVQPSRPLTLIGTRMVSGRLSRRQVLDDVRRGKFRLSAFQPLTGQVSEAFNWPDGSTCRDAVSIPGLLLSPGTPQAPPLTGRTIPVAITANGGGPGSDVFRTHCPGPDDADLFGTTAEGGNPVYARGSVTTAQLLAQHSVLTLSRPGPFNGRGYGGSRSGSIGLDLTLTKITAETQP